MDKRISMSSYLFIGFMLFALFFGGGNLIFPAFIGQSAGTNVWAAIGGFLVTGVGLPLLGLLAIGIAGVDDVHALAAKVHPKFATIYSLVLYLSIGPLCALPRTGTVSYEIGIAPFIGASDNTLKLAIYTVIFFGISLWLSFNPSKIVDRIGKVLTPIMLLFILILIIMSFVKPLGSQTPPVEPYITSPFVSGFIQGYNTLDALAALAFGIIVINAVKSLGVVSKKAIGTATVKAGMIAVACLAFVYIFVGYIGSTSADTLGYFDNGAPILSGASGFFLGSLGQIALSIIILLACLTTSVGLITACSEYFSKIAPRFNYKTYAIGITCFSCIVANIGLAKIIQFSTPILLTIYPLTIVLIALTFLNPLFHGRQIVYVSTVAFTGVISIVDGIHGFGISLGWVDDLLNAYLPLYGVSLGWVPFALVGFIVGLILSKWTPTSSRQEAVAK